MVPSAPFLGKFPKLKLSLHWALFEHSSHGASTGFPEGCVCVWFPPGPSNELHPLRKQAPGEEQVGFVLQVKIQVGEVVLLGALLLLAVTEMGEQG